MAVISSLSLIKHWETWTALRYKEWTALSAPGQRWNTRTALRYLDSAQISGKCWFTWTALRYSTMTALRWRWNFWTALRCLDSSEVYGQLWDIWTALIYLDSADMSGQRRVIKIVLKLYLTFVKTYICKLYLNITENNTVGAGFLYQWLLSGLITVPYNHPTHPPQH